MEKKYVLSIDGETREVPEGTRLRELAREYQGRYQHQIILARLDGGLCELRRKITRNCTVSFVTTEDTAGHSAYKRTVIFILLKAIYDTVGKKNVEKAVIRYSMDNGIFFNMEGMNGLTQDFIDRVKAKMEDIVKQDIPINKRSVRTEDAIRIFHRHHMYDKEKLFTYRRGSSVNIYSIESFDDYFYGYMADRTGAASLFDLRLYDDGFILVLPKKSEPEHLRETSSQTKIFNVQKESREWGEKLQVSTVGELNDCIAKDRIRDIVLIQEALHEAKISSIAEKIADRKDARFVMIAGPSSSGKTTFSHRLSVQLSAHGLRPHPIAVDNYFVNRENTPLDDKGEKDYECLEAIDLEAFNQDMTDLLQGKRVMLPTYNFVSGEREYKGDSLQLGKDDILVIEGIHGLNSALSYSLPDESKFKVYISALTQLNIDEHNRIPTTDGRLIRRIIRDARTRGISAAETIRRWPSVRRGEEQFIFGFQENADVMFNSALVYELASLKIYAEPLLFGIDRESPEYEEAKRLMKFFDYFLPVPGDDVPNNSILREFIGGSIFGV
ncbi:MAG: nucleoside kinase [Blautia sp.]|nr:nucleoside kinase [Blautia sp.]